MLLVLAPVRVLVSAFVVALGEVAAVLDVHLIIRPLAIEAHG